MKWTWSLISIAAFLALAVCGASINNENLEETQDRAFDWGKFNLTSIGDKIKESLEKSNQRLKDAFGKLKEKIDKLKEKFGNWGKNFTEKNEKAKECIAAFMKELNSTVDASLYSENKPYANAVDSIVEEAANPQNGTAPDTKDPSKNPKLDDRARKALERIVASIKARADCYKKAFAQDAGQPTAAVPEETTNAAATEETTTVTVTEV